MEDEEAWLKDSLAKAVKVLGKSGQSPRVIRGVEEAFQRARGTRVMVDNSEEQAEIPRIPQLAALRSGFRRICRHLVTDVHGTS